MLGVIADDVTGGTDVALSFTKAGLSTLIIFGQPRPTDLVSDHQVVVIALKTRMAAPQEAVRESLTAATWLRKRGAQQLFFKYCSTFDSSSAGNIGQVCDVLADTQAAPITVVVPASPEHLRTQYMGNLFVAQQPLAESPMKDHPLTPMRDSNVVRLLTSQTSRPTALIAHDEVRKGAAAVRKALDDLQRAGTRYAVVDALTAEDLATVGQACVHDPLLTGAAGLAAGVGQALALQTGHQPGHSDPVGAAPAAVLAGSCSARTREQVAYMRDRQPSYFLDARTTPDAKALATAALAWVDTLEPGTCPLIYSTMGPDALRTTQDTLGVAASAHILETATGLVAQGLRERGTRRLVIAGGETSGAVLNALGVRGGVIGREVAPGVPWIYTSMEHPMALLLKSGNFGERDLLFQAVHVEVATEQQSFAWAAPQAGPEPSEATGETPSIDQPVPSLRTLQEWPGIH
jgi:uncharacterized protein YgbK (DUF1537 family)